MTKAYKFDLEVKGQHQIGNMNLCVTFSHGDRPMCQIWLANVKSKNSYGPDTKTCQKPCKFDLEVKVQDHIWVMNVRAHGLMAMHLCGKLGKRMSKKKKNMVCTQICRQTDRQTDIFDSDSYITP